MSGNFFEENLRVGGAPGFKFRHNAEGIAQRREAPLIGHGVVGDIVDVSQPIQATDYATKEKKVDKNGNPVMQVVVILQTQLRGWQDVTGIPVDDNDQPLSPNRDDGKRAVYIKNQMARAVAKALKEAGGMEQVRRGLVVGDKIAFKVSGYQDVGRGTPMVEFAAKYWVQQTSGSFEGQLANEAPPQQAPTPDPFAANQAPAAAPPVTSAAPAGAPPAASAPAPQQVQQTVTDPFANG